MSPSITIDNKFILQLNKYLVFLINHLQSIQTKSNVTKNLICQIRLDFNQRYICENQSLYQKYLLLIYNLCLIKSTKIHFQLIEKQYYYSKQFYKKNLNIQLLTDIEQYQKEYNQSIQCLNELKIIFYQYEYNLKQLKEKLFEQNKQILNYSSNLFQIQYEQNQIELNIQQLKEKILFEKRLYYEIKQILNFYFKFDQRHFQVQSIVNLNLENEFHTEYIHLSTQIMQMKFNIEQTSNDLLILQHELNIYSKINHMNDIKSSTQSLFIPTKNLEPMITKLQVPVESMNKSRQSKFKLVIKRLPN